MPITGTDGSEIIDGTSGADEILGLAGNDTINGLGGNDTIYGGLGNDTLNGGDGDDLFIEDEFTGPQDVFNGGAGTDTIELRVISNPIIAQPGTLSPHTMTGASSLTSIERIVFASTSGNVVQGTILHGTVASSGLTEVVAGAGRDFFVLATGAASGAFTIPTLTYTGFTPAATNAWDAPNSDLVIMVSNAAAGTSVTLNAATGLNVFQLLIGGAGNDTLNGSANADALNGGGGTNQLNGGDGNDSLAIVNQYLVGPGGFGPPTNFDGSGSTLDGGTGTDVLTIGGLVDLQATLVSIEGVQLQPAFTPPVANTQKQDAAVLLLDGAHIAMLPSNAFFTGTGTVAFLPDDGSSLSLANYVLTPGSAVNFVLYAGMGNGLTFTGSAGDDYIELYFGAQTAIGGAGDDRIVFGAGNQTATGGAGVDRFGVGIGSGLVTDFVIGEDKIDFSDTDITNEGRLGDLNFVQNGANATISADSGGDHYEMVLQNIQLANLSVSDVILGTGGFAVFDSGTQFDDLMFGHELNDNLSGGSGNDRLYSGGGVDVLSGGDGNDVIIIDGVVGFGGTYDGGAGSDSVLVRYNGPNTFQGLFGVFTGIERLEFDGEAGQSIAAGVPFFALGSGLGTVIGSAASDVFVVVATTGGTYNLNALTLTNWNTAQANTAGGDVLALVAANGLAANVTLNARSDIGNQTLIGANGNDTLNGSAFADFLRGGGGNDTIVGGAGADTMEGDTGDDIFFVDTQADLVFELAGADYDTIVASTSFYLYANVESLILSGATAAQFGVGNALDNSIEGNENGNLLLGGAGNDTLYGLDGNDVLYGEDGADTINGGNGVDFLAGGLGNDQLRGDGGADALFGEDGNDTLEGGSSFDTDILVGGAGNDTLNGVSGQANPDYDLLYGEAGDDSYFVDTGDDLTFEDVGGGADVVYADITVPNAGVYLYANVEKLVLLGTTAFGVGNELDNFLVGSDSGNWLLGGAGNDRIEGGGGNDVLFGEAGTDTFVLGVNEGADLIGDFNATEDVIEFAGIFTSYAEVQANMVEVDNNMAIDLGGGNLVVLLDTQIADLSASNFLFG